MSDDHDHGKAMYRVGFETAYNIAIDELFTQLFALPVNAPNAAVLREAIEGLQARKAELLEKYTG